MNEDSVIPPLVSSGFEPFDISGFPPNRWQDQLLPVNTVLAEEDVTVLRQEVEAAHQLLQYQQRLIDSLTEQLVGNEAHRTQLEQDLAVAQRHTNKEAEQLKEFQSICKDLRSQIRKQQARIYEYKTVLKQNSNTLLPNKVSRRFVSFGYASVSVDGLASSSSPVSPWSATDPVNLTNAFAICCRKLAALGLENSSEVEVQEISAPQMQMLSPQVSATPNSQSSSPSPLASVELPSFVK